MFIVSDVRLDCYLARQRSQPSTDATGDGDLEFVEGWSIGFAYTPPDAMCRCAESRVPLYLVLAGCVTYDYCRILQFEYSCTVLYSF